MDHDIICIEQQFLQANMISTFLHGPVSSILCSKEVKL